MAKKKMLYTIDETTGKYVPITHKNDIHAEQIRFDFDETEENEEIVDVDVDQLLTLLDDGWTVDAEDVRDELIFYIDKLRNTFLNGIYRVNKADAIEDVSRADRVTKEEIDKVTDNIDNLFSVFYKSCLNEYQAERDDAYAALKPEKLN